MKENGYENVIALIAMANKYGQLKKIVLCL